MKVSMLHSQNLSIARGGSIPSLAIVRRLVVLLSVDLLVYACLSIHYLDLTSIALSCWNIGTGDSGGPAFDKHGVQVGVNSFVENFGDDPQTSCRVNFWTVNNDYTDVRDNLRWIRSAIKS